MDEKTPQNEEEWVRGLIQSIHEEISAHQTLLNKLKAQQFAIIDRDVSNLFDINSQTKMVTEEAKKASNRRISVLQSGQKFRPSYEYDSIERVIPLVQKEFSDKLTDQRERLLALVQEIKSTNSVTKFLLHQSINYVNQNLQFIVSEIENSGSYGSNGNHLKRTKLSTISKLS